MKKQLPFFIVAILLVGAGCQPADQVSSDEPIGEVAGESQEQQEALTEEINQEPIMKSYEFPGVLEADRIENKRVRIKTAHGDIVFELFADTAPKTVSNFVYLAEEGYYDGLTFHRREENFVIQGGDPNGNGTGGPGYRFEDELEDEYSYERGIVAMANAGPDTNGSQFFIMLMTRELPKAYSIFGRVVEGLEIVDKVQIGDEMTEVVVEDKE